MCVSLDGVATTLVASCGISWESRLRSVLPGPNGFVMVGFFTTCSDKHLCEGAARGRRGRERGWGGKSESVEDALLLCWMFTCTCGSISTNSGAASMSSTFNQGVSCCADQSSASLDDVNTAAAKFLNLNVRSFHSAAVESKLVNSKMHGARWKVCDVFIQRAQVLVTSPLPLLRSYSRCLTSRTTELTTDSLRCACLLYFNDRLQLL